MSRDWREVGFPGWQYILMFSPFSGKFAKFLENRIAQNSEGKTEFIQAIPLGEHKEFILGLKKEKNRYYKICQKIVEQSIESPDNMRIDEMAGDDFYHIYEEAKQLEGEVSRGVLAFETQELSEEDIQSLSEIKDQLRTYGLALKTFKDVVHNLKEFQNSPVSSLKEIHQYIQVHYRDIEDNAGSDELTVTAKNFGKAMEEKTIACMKDSALSEKDLVSALNLVHEMKQVVKLMWMENSAHQTTFQ
ncbi:MAG: hypothetical protein HRU19_12365 [Pseudobacteriovorax sp.]|nr:hypothetical protein [Pseudobacteriovorax sp.]